MSGLPQPRFPDGNALARSLFEEGIRHLEDARVLHEAGRCPGSIASSMKAAELGIKALIVLDGAMGWWDKVFTTHSPLSDIKNLAVFQPHVVMLESYRSTLIRDVVEMEKLAPARPGGAYEIDVQKNPEYPFLSYQVNPADNSGQFRLDKPSMHFVGADSQFYYNTAQNLLTAISTQYVSVTNWGLTIPASL